MSGAKTLSLICDKYLKKTEGELMILFIIIVTLLAAILFLGGEGDNYGKGSASSNGKRKVSISDKNFLL